MKDNNIHKISQSFSKKARDYSDRADIQSEIAYSLCNLLSNNFYTGDDVKALDIGCVPSLSPRKKAFKICKHC